VQTFSPREVQARVRAGDSAEVVAADTGWPLEKVIRYAEPLLAERAFIAEQAQSVEVRRSGGGATLLESAYAAIGVDPDAGTVSWDAWRREDGRWIVAARYVDSRGTHTARWTYDHGGRNLHALDDEARTLMGARPLPVPDPEAEIAEALDLVQDIAVVREQPGRPRLVAVPDTDTEDTNPEEGDEAEPNADAAEPVVDDTEPTITLPHPATVPAPAAEPRPEPSVPAPAVAPAAKPARKPKAKRGGRASVPSWDEILFGATKHED
jgi:hypothetical protein